MADNVIADAGSGGETFATDQRVSDSVHFPLSKLVWGALDTFNIVDTASGGPLPVQLRLNAGTVVGDATTPLVVTDDGNAILVDGSAVTQPVSGTVTANIGAVGTLATETTLADVKTAVELIDNAVAGSELQVDIVAPLPAGTNAIGKLAANSGVDIGDVDVLSLPSNTYVADTGSLGLGVLIQGDDGLSARKNVLVDSAGHLQVDVLSGGGGGGTEYTEGTTQASIVGTAFLWEDTSDVVRAVSALNPLPVGGAGGSLTIDSSDLSTLAGAVAGSEFQVDLVGIAGVATEATLAAAIAVDGAADGSGILIQGDDGVNRKNVSVDATTGNVQVDVQNSVTVTNTTLTTLDNAIVAEDDPAGPPDLGIPAMARRQDTPATDTDTDGDYTYIKSDSVGRLHTTSPAIYTEGDTDASITGVPILWEDAANTLATPTASNGLPVNVVAGSTAGTEFNQGASQGATDAGGVALVVRNDTDAVLSGIDTGEYTALQVDASGFLKVNIKAGAGSGGTAQADESAFIEGTTNITPVGGVLNDTPVSDPGDNEAAAFRITAKRALHSNIRDNAGTELGVAASPFVVGITNTADTLVKAGDAVNDAMRVNVVAGATSGTEFSMADNAGDTDAGSIALVIRRDADTILPTIADDDYTALQVNATGALKVTGDDGGSLTVDNVGLTSLDGAITGTEVQVDIVDPGTIATEATLLDVKTAVELIDNVVNTPNSALASMNAVGAQMDDTTTVVATEGNVSALRINAQRGLHVQVTDSSGVESGTVANPLVVTGDSTGSLTVDNQGLSDLDDATAALQALYSKQVVVGGHFDDVSTTVITEGNVGATRITSQRAWHVNLRNVAGTEIGTTSDPLVITDDGAAILVDGSGVVQPVSGTVSVTGVATETTLADVKTAVELIDNTVYTEGDTDTTITGIPILWEDAGNTLATPTASNGLPVNIVAGSSAGTEFAQDTAFGASDAGSVSLVVRNDTDAPLGTVADLDYTALQVDANGYLKVNIKAGSGSGGTALQDETSFVEGTTDLTPVGGVLNDTPVSDPGDNEAAAFRITAKRGLHVNLRNNSGVEIGDATTPLIVNDDGTPILVDNSAQTQPVSNSGLTALDGAITGTEVQVDIVDIAGIATQSTLATVNTAVELIDDTVHSANAALVAMNAVGAQMDDTTTVVATEGNVSALRINAQRGLHVQVTDSAGAETGTTGNPFIVTDDGSPILVDSSGQTQPVSGTVSVTGVATETTLAALEGHFAVTDTAYGSGVLVQADDGTDRHNILCDTAGHLQIDVLTAPTTTVTGTVTANAGTGTFTVGGTVTANLGTIAGVATETTLDAVKTAVELIDDAVHTENAALSKAVAIAGELDDAATTAATEDGVASVRITAQRGLHTNLRNVAGTEIGTAGAPIRTDPTGSTAQPVSGTVAVSSITTAVVPGTGPTNLGKAEDAQHVDGDTGVFMLGVVQSASQSHTDGDYEPIGLTTSGRVKTQTRGDTAHDASDANSLPVGIGGRAISHKANPTPVDAGDRSYCHTNRHGVMFTIGGHPNSITRQLNVTDADGVQNNTALVAAGGANVKIVVTRILVACDNANTVDVAVRMGFAAATTPANDAIGVVASHPGIPPGGGFNTGDGGGILGIGAGNEALLLTCEDPVGGAVDITVTYYTITEA
jgi:hypothetical protein